MISYSASLRLVAGGGFEPPFIRFPALWEVRDLPSDEEFLTLCCRAHHCGGAKGGNRTLCPKPHSPCEAIRTIAAFLGRYRLNLTAKPGNMLCVCA